MTTETTPEHTIAALCRRSDEVSRAAGWIDDNNPRPFKTGSILMHSELSEALEDYRAHKPLNETYYEMKFIGEGDQSTGGAPRSLSLSNVSEEEARLIAVAGGCPTRVSKKPCGIPTELADFVIRVCQECGMVRLGDLLGQAFDATKMAVPIVDFDDMLVRAHLAVSKAYEVNTLRGECTMLETTGAVYLLADGLRTLFAFCEHNKIDIWAAIDEKEAFNRTRAFRHGGSAASHEEG